MSDLENTDSRADRFMWRPGDVHISQCFYCARWHSGPGSTCDAFPRGVPMEILTNDFDHREPHPDDNGLTFEAREGANWGTT